MADMTSEDVAQIAELVVRDVAELPDRTSPDDWPEAMLVTGEELYTLIVKRFAESDLSRGEAAHATLEAKARELCAELYLDPDARIVTSGPEPTPPVWERIARAFASVIPTEPKPHHPEAGAPSREAIEKAVSVVWSERTPSIPWDGLLPEWRERMVGDGERFLSALSLFSPQSLKESEREGGDPLADRISALAGNLLHVLPAGKVYLAHDAANLAEEVRALLSERPAAGGDQERRAAPLSTISAANRDTTQLPARDLTDAELANELARVDELWTELKADLEESGGHGGAPGEWMVERMDEIATEQSRRAALKETNHGR